MDLDLDNLEKQCRFCLKHISVDDHHEELFTEGVINSILKEKMTKCLNMKEIDWQERIPDKICQVCAKKLDEFYFFSSEFDINQEKLKHSTIKTGLLIENINSKQGRDHNAVENAIESGHHLLVLKRQTFIPERLKVSAIKYEHDALNIANTKVSDGIDNSLAVILNKKEKEEYQLNKISDEVIKREPKPENIDFKPATTIDKLTPPYDQWAMNNIYECQICLSQFKNESEVQRHMEMHLNESHVDRELTQDCNAISTSNFDFHHSSTNVVPDKVGFDNLGSTSMKIICKICKKGFFTRSRYDLHVVKEHDPETEVPPRRKGRIFQCNDCNKVFKNKVDITRHVMIHVKRKSPHVCSICGKEYVFPVALRTHMLRHNPDYKIECSVCLETFTKRKDLKAHKCRSISPSKKYKCFPCRLEFDSLNYLKTHEEIDHGIGPRYNCTYCTRTFLSNYGLISHMKEQHQSHIDDFMSSIDLSMKIVESEEKQATDLLFDADLTTSLEILMCSLCGALSLTNQEFQEHMTGHLIM